MKTIRVNLKERSYPIIIGSGILKDFGKFASRITAYRRAYLITNPGIYRKFGKELTAGLKARGFEVKFKLVGDSEESKSFAVAVKVIDDLAAFDRNKRALVVALGGGVVGDLAGFIAAIYKRGIPYMQVPTTLLAQVDSAIGGKTAVDLKCGKNLVGAIYQPKMVFSDTLALKSLPPRQLASGIAEVIKYAAIKDPALFRYLEKHYASILRLENAPLEFIVSRCSRIKAEIVGSDEKEGKGIRTILNFGHTIGHAVETATGYRGYTHGEAIGLGMLAAADISCRLGLSGRGTAERIEALLKVFRLPVRIEGAPLQKIIASHYLDKKFISGKNRFVLIREIGKTAIKDNLPLRIIEEAIKGRMKKTTGSKQKV